MQRLLLDTDIGTNADDLVALVLCLKSEAIKLEGVTTVSGDVDIRARIVFKVLQLCQAGHVPVAAGSRGPLIPTAVGREFRWAGYEGEGILSPEDSRLKPFSSDAVELMVSKLREGKGEIKLVAIGPLTNIAQALKQEPLLAHYVKELVLMGGSISPPHEEYNIMSDPEAAKLVFASGMPITMVGLNVTRRVLLGREEVQRIKEAGGAVAELMADQVERYLKYKGVNKTPMHDPLAVAVAIDRSFVTTERMNTTITAEGRTVPGGENQAIDVCVDVDVPRFMDFLLSTLTRKYGGFHPPY